MPPWCLLEYGGNPQRPPLRLAPRFSGGRLRGGPAGVWPGGGVASLRPSGPVGGGLRGGFWPASLSWPLSPTRYFLGAEDGIRTRDPHLGNVVFSVSMAASSPPPCAPVHPVSITSTPVVERSTSGHRSGDLPGPVCGTADSGPHDDIVPSGPIVTIPSIRRRSGLVTLSGTSRMGPQARPVELLEDVDDTPSSRRPEEFSFPCTSFGVGLQRHTILMTAPIALGLTGPCGHVKSKSRASAPSTTYRVNSRGRARRPAVCPRRWGGTDSKR